MVGVRNDLFLLDKKGEGGKTVAVILTAFQLREAILS